MRIFVPAFGRINTRNRDGGAVRFIELSKRWQSSGIRLNFLISEREAKLMQEEGVKGIFSILPDWIRSEKDNLWNVFLVYFLRLLQSFFYKTRDTFDIIYSPSDFIADVAAGIWAKKRNHNAKFVVCIFLIAPNPFIGYRNVWRKGWGIPTVRGIFFYLLQKGVIILCRIYADKVFVLNEIDRHYLEKQGLKGRVYTVNMGISLSEISKIAPDIENQFDGIFIGRLHPQKGVDDLIKIWKLVSAKKPGLKLAIIGGGDETVFRKLELQIKVLGCDGRIKILGFHRGSDKFSLLKSAKIFLMPSYYESWGLVVLEAMACGLPVVAYDLPVYKEKFKGGISTARIGDAADFAEKVLAILENKMRYNRLQSEVFQVAGEYDLDIIAKRELGLITG